MYIIRTITLLQLIIIVKADLLVYRNVLPLDHFGVVSFSYAGSVAAVSLQSFRSVLVLSAGQTHPTLQWKMLFSSAKFISIVSLVGLMVAATRSNKTYLRYTQCIQRNIEYVSHFFNQCINTQQKNKHNCLLLIYVLFVRLECIVGLTFS